MQAKQAELQRCEEEKQKMESLVAAKEAELEAILKEIAHDAEQTQQLKALVPTKTQQVEHVQSQMHQLRSTIVAYTVEINAAKREIQRADHLYFQRRAPDEQIQRELERLQELYPKLQEELAKAQRKAAGDGDDSECAVLAKRLQDAQSTRAQLAAHVETAEASIQAFQAEIASNRAKAEEVAEQARKHQRDGTQLREEAEGLEASVDAARRRLQQLKHSEQELSQKHVEQLAAAQKELEEKRLEIDRVRQQNAELRIAIANSQAAQRDQLLEQETLKEKQVEQAKRALIAKQKQKIAELRKQLEHEDRAFRDAFQTCEHHFETLKAQLVAELEVLEEAQVARPATATAARAPVVAATKPLKSAKPSKQSRPNTSATATKENAPVTNTNNKSIMTTSPAAAATKTRQPSRPPLQLLVNDAKLSSSTTGGKSGTLSPLSQLSQPRSYAR